MSRGDETAARQFYARIGPRISAYARALLRDDAAADDVVQQVWLRAIARPERELSQVRDATAWLVSITRSIALNHVRTRTRSITRLQLNLATHADAAPPRDHADLRHAIDALPDDQREVVLLKHVADLTFDQIALTLDENRSTLASRYRTAIATLRNHLHAPQEATYA